MGSTDESFSNTGYGPKDYFLTETYVEFNLESMTEQRIPEQRFLEDVDYDDAAIGEMLFKAYREQVYDSQREGLSVGQSSSSMSDGTGQPAVENNGKKTHDRTVQPVVETGQGLAILADFQAEIRRDKFQDDYDRRSVQKLSETIESQQEELHRRLSYFRILWHAWLHSGYLPIVTSGGYWSIPHNFPRVLGRLMEQVCFLKRLLKSVAPVLRQVPSRPLHSLRL